MNFKNATLLSLSVLSLAATLSTASAMFHRGVDAQAEPARHTAAPAVAAEEVVSRVSGTSLKNWMKDTNTWNGTTSPGRTLLRQLIKSMGSQHVDQALREGVTSGNYETRYTTVYDIFRMLPSEVRNPIAEDFVREIEALNVSHNLGVDTSLAKVTETRPIPAASSSSNAAREAELAATSNMASTSAAVQPARVRFPYPTPDLWSALFRDAQVPTEMPLSFLLLTKPLRPAMEQLLGPGECLEPGKVLSVRGIDQTLYIWMPESVVRSRILGSNGLWLAYTTLLFEDSRTSTESSSMIQRSFSGKAYGNKTHLLWGAMDHLLNKVVSPTPLEAVTQTMIGSFGDSTSENSADKKLELIGDYLWQNIEGVRPSASQVAPIMPSNGAISRYFPESLQADMQRAGVAQIAFLQGGDEILTIQDKGTGAREAYAEAIRHPVIMTVVSDALRDRATVIVPEDMRWGVALPSAS